MSDDTVFSSWYLITVSDKSCSASLTCNNLTSLAISRTVAIRRAAKHNLFVVLAFKGTGAIFFVWNPFQQESQWIIPETKSRISLGSLCGVSALQLHVYRVLCRACWCGSATKISIDGKLRQKKNWMKEKVHFELSYSSPSTQQWFEYLQAQCRVLIEDIFFSIEFAVETQHYPPERNLMILGIISTKRDL